MDDHLVASVEDKVDLLPHVLRHVLQQRISVVVIEKTQQMHHELIPHVLRILDGDLVVALEAQHEIRSQVGLVADRYGNEMVPVRQLGDAVQQVSEDIVKASGLTLQSQNPGSI